MIDEKTIRRWIDEAQQRKAVPTVETIRAIGRSEAQKAVMNGRPQYFVQTTDATPTVICTIPIEDYYGGKFTLELVAVEDTGSGGSLAVEQRIKFWKAGTLTIDTPVDVMPLDTDITGATFAVNNVSENIEISVIGVAATVIKWVMNPPNILQTNATTLP